MTQILNVAGYKFIALVDLPELRLHLLQQAQQAELKGTILLGAEGINLALAGVPAKLTAFLTYLESQPLFAGMSFRRSYSATQPFKRLKVKLKQEIIALRQPNVQPAVHTAPTITPVELQRWLEERRDITLLDTRNAYEVEMGTFEKAESLALKDFGEFPHKMSKVARDKPVVMFCTGGIRCEKAALVMLNAGYSEVYQLQGGILGYFAEVGGAHYAGTCFVFDERVAVDSTLQPIN